MPDVKFSNLYPYTDFHELNLDWVISQVKYWSERVGKSIQTIEKTGTVGLVDTYTITYSDGSTSTFDVTNGNGIASVAKTGTAGLVDTYTITFQDGSTTTFEVHNGTASIDDTLTLQGYAADAKATGDILLPLGETTIQLPGTPTAGKYIDFYSVSVGSDWTTLLQNNANSTYLTSALDLTNYVGKTLKIVATVWGSGSTRAMGFCDSNNIVSKKYAEANVPNPGDLAGFTLIDGKYVAELPISNTHFFFTMSGGASNTVTFYVISPGILTRLNNDYYTKPEVDAMISGGAVYVDGVNGNDANDGSELSPFKTIQAGVNAGVGTVYITPGTYSEQVNISGRIGLRLEPSEYGSYSSSIPDTPKIVIDGNDTLATGITVTDSVGIHITGVELVDFTSRGMYISNSKDVEVVNSIASGCWTGGFVLLNTCAIFRDCIAHDIAHTGVPHPDGFNIHGYGDTQFIDCVAYNCGDDGISHHDGCTGYIKGGEYYNCGKGGVSSPTHGANIDIDGVYSHDNVYGLYAANDSNRTVKGRVSNCVFKNNSYKDIYVKDGVLTGWNNIYDNLKVEPGATFTEIV